MDFQQSKYPVVQYNDMLRSSTVIWQTEPTRFCMMHWRSLGNSEFVAGFKSYEGARNYMDKEFAPIPLPE